jgi:predicted dehydrogenase
MSFRVCIIGCGEQSRVAHGPSLRRYAAVHREVELASCCDPDPVRAKSFSRDFGFRKSYTEMEAMFTEESPDAAVMAVPTTLSAGIAVRILRRGIPLMMEKPPAMNEAEVRLLARIAEERSVPHLVAFNRRFMPLMVETEKLLRATGSARDIQLISYDMFRVDRRDPDFSTTAVHAIDAVRFLAGSPYEGLRVSYQDLPALGPTVANILIDGTVASGARVRITICPAAGVVVERATVHLHGHSIFLHLPEIGRAHV